MYCNIIKNFIDNFITVRIERYNQQDENRTLLASYNIGTKQVKQDQKIYFYINQENYINETNKTRFIIEIQGSVKLYNVNFKLNSIQEYIPTNTYNLSFPVKSRIGGRKKYSSTPTIGTLLSQEIDENKYLVYYRFQLDFYNTFDSQENNLPLRDIIYSNLTATGEIPGGSINEKIEYGRIKGGAINNGTFRVNKDVTNAASSTVTNAVKELLEESKKIETEKVITSSGEQIKINFDPNNDKRKYGNIAIRKTDLPGQWINKIVDGYLRKDISKNQNGNFNGEYFWRFAPYNVVECPYKEISHSIIQNFIIINNEITMNIKPLSHQIIKHLQLSGIFWLAHKHSNPKWILDGIQQKEVKNKEQLLIEKNKGVVQFPTEQPVDENNNYIIGHNAISIVPYSRERSKPTVVKDNNFDYYMLYSKPSNFNQNVIVQATGKSYFEFGELSQIYPKYNMEKYKEELSIFAPSAIIIDASQDVSEKDIFVSNYSSINAQIFVNKDNQSNISAQLEVINKEVYQHIESFISVKQKKQNKNKLFVWANAQYNNKCQIVLFKSDSQLMDFDNPIKCNNTDNCLHPFVWQQNNMFYMTYMKNNNEIYMADSMDGVNWQNEKLILKSPYNVTSPSIIKFEDKYYLFLTEWNNQNSKIVSYSGNDIFNLNQKRIEIEQYQKQSFVIQEKIIDGNKEQTKNKNTYIIRQNPKNPCVIEDYLHGNKIMRMFYNTEIICEGIIENKICSAYYEDKEWMQIKTSKNNVMKNFCYIQENQQNNGIYSISIQKPENVKNIMQVRAEINLSQDYYENNKECILQSDWINKDNCSEYEADISPNRKFIYNDIVLQKNYSGDMDEI
jgi:hypothetical protein